jgi:hypothetical protein
LTAPLPHVYMRGSRPQGLRAAQGIGRKTP